MSCMEKKEMQRFVLAINPVIRNSFALSERHIALLKEYLSQALGREVAVELRDNYDETLGGMERGEIDAAALGPYAFALAQARFGARALAHNIDVAPPGTSPVAPYRSVIITRADSGIKSPVELKGRSFGFVDRKSTTGYLVATFLLQQAGLDPATDIQPAFLLSHEAVLNAVAQGEVVAGAVQYSRYLHYCEDATRPQLLVLDSSPLLSRGPIAVRPNIAPQLERALLSALLQIHQAAPEAARVFLAPTQRFTPASQREMTLKTIAELVGVSYGTVSRAINGHGRIAPATMARVTKLVEELGYRPNASARDLHKSRGDLIGLVVPTLSYPGLDAIVGGIQETLDQAQMRLLVCPVGRPASVSVELHQKGYFDLLYNNRIEGLLLTQWSVERPETLELIQSGRPMALLEQELLTEGLQTALKWLREQGRDSIFLLPGSHSLLEPALTRRMFSQLAGPGGNVLNTPDELLPILEQHGVASSAVLCTDDQMAESLRQCLADKNLHPLIMGMGNSFLAQWANLPSLAFDGTQLGQLAAQRLLKKLTGDPIEAKQVLRTWVETRMPTSDPVS